MFDPRLPDGTIDAHAMQGATGDGCVRDKRPMTEAEERLVEAALEFRRLPEATEARATARRNVEAWANAVENERQPRPITPEERAVVEAAKRYVSSRSGCDSVETYDRLIDAVRRLP